MDNQKEVKLEEKITDAMPVAVDALVEILKAQKTESKYRIDAVRGIFAVYDNLIKNKEIKAMVEHATDHIDDSSSKLQNQLKRIEKRNKPVWEQDDDEVIDGD